MQRQLILQNGVVMTGSSSFHSQGQGFLESKAVSDTRALAADLCRHFYTLGWVSGVQKERMIPEDMYLLSSDGFVLSTPPVKPFPHRSRKCTDCAPIFMKVYEMCGAGAVIHSHGMEACLVTMINPFSKEFQITHMEMIKGIQGHGYHDKLVLPIIENTAHEGELTEYLVEAIRAYPEATGVLVRNHGVFIWGDSWISTKTQAECYHYLFEAAIKLYQLGLDWSTPSHGPIRFNGVGGCGLNFRRGSNAGLSLDYMIEPSQYCVLLNIEGTTSPRTLVGNILFRYAHEIVGKHLGATYDTEETQCDINLLHSQVQSNLNDGIVGAVPSPSNYVGKHSVNASLVANAEAMFRADRKVIALRQLPDNTWKTGFKSNGLVGFVFDDVPKALERWQASGIKVYVYSSASRVAQQLLFANSSFGDLRKYICGYFDTTVGNKTETHSYNEILQTVGIDRPSDILFVTDDYREAVAARASGLQVIVSIRPGNGPLPENHGFRIIKSFLEI